MPSSAALRRVTNVAPAGATSPASDEYAAVVPVESLARTVSASVWPASAVTCVYVAAVEPRSVLHFAPRELQRYHWNAKEIVPPPDQTPACAASFEPTPSDPLMRGGPRSSGPGATRTTSLAALSTDSLAAVTTAITTCPASAAASV